MASYAWRGRNARGELISGQVEAADDNAVADQLLAGGVTPVQIQAVSARNVLAGVGSSQAGLWQALRQRAHHCRA